MPIEHRLHVLVRVRRRQDEVLHRHEVVLHALRFGLGIRQERRRATAKRRLRSAGNMGQRVEARGKLPHEPTRLCSSALHERSPDAALLFEHGDEQVLRNELGVAALGRKIHCCAQGFLTFRGESVESHGLVLCAASSPHQHAT